MTDIALIEEVKTLLSLARRVETPCGAGSMVWHHWGEESCQKSLVPVVLVHGGSGSWTHWLANIAALVQSGREVLVPDLPGFGDSAPPLQGTDADVMPEPLEQGLQRLLGNRACDLVGFSFGGMVAGLIATKFSARVARLVLVGAPGLGITPETPLQLSSWRHLPEAAQRDAVHRSNLAALMLHHPEAITELALRLHVANVLRDRMRGRSLSRTDVLARALPQVVCRVDAIYGSEDALYRDRMPLLESALRQAKNFGSLHLIEAAGHWVQFEQPKAFNQALLAVLNLDLVSKS